MFKKYHLMNYLPVRYQATEAQQEERNICYKFKEGFVSDEVLQLFLEKIQYIIESDIDSWIICFIPASTQWKTEQRFKHIASAIKDRGYNVDIAAIYNKEDRLPEHISGKTNNPIEKFGIDQQKIFNKKVLLIDDIITRGVTFSCLGQTLEHLGAISIVGLFLAQTINPNFTEHHDSINFIE